MEASNTVFVCCSLQTSRHTTDASLQCPDHQITRSPERQHNAGIFPFHKAPPHPSRYQCPPTRASFTCTYDCIHTTRYNAVLKLGKIQIVPTFNTRTSTRTQALFSVPIPDPISRTSTRKKPINAMVAHLGKYAVRQAGNLFLCPHSPKPLLRAGSGKREAPSNHRPYAPPFPFHPQPPNFPPRPDRPCLT